MTTADIRRARARGVAALAEREVLRVLRLWTQTIAPPVVAAVLFIVVFGVALGGSIKRDRRRPLRAVHRPRAWC